MRIENVLIGCITISLFVTMGALMYVDTMQKAGVPLYTTYLNGTENGTGVYVDVFKDTVDLSNDINDKLSQNSSISNRETSTAELIGRGWDILMYIPRSVANTMSLITHVGGLMGIHRLVITFITTVLLIVIVFSIIYLIFIGRT